MDITEFLRTGSILNIETGMTLDDYNQRFEEIEEAKKHYYDKENLSFGFSYYHNGIELMFVDGLLNTISIDPSAAVFTVLDKVALHVYIGLERMIALLEILDLEWEILQKYTFRHQLLLELTSGVQLSFKYEAGHGFLFSRAQKYNQ